MLRAMYATRVSLITKTCLELKVVHLGLVCFFVCLFVFGLLFIMHLKEAGVCVCVCVCVYAYVCVYTGCPRRNGPNFGRVFLMLN